MNPPTEAGKQSGRLGKLFFVLACLATLLGLFYALENWRGKRAWENYRRELEAGGKYHEWSAIVPPPIPDEENVFKAPGMPEWFVRENFRKSGSSEKKARPFSIHSPLPKGNTNLVLIAELTWVQKSSDAPRSSNRVWKVETDSARNDALELTKQSYRGTLRGVQGNQFLFTAGDLGRMEPVQVSLESDQPPTLKTIRTLFPDDSKLPGQTWLQVKTASSNSWQIWLDLSSRLNAADYIAWTDLAKGDWELIRTALNRPRARMDGNYEQPYARPIPDFIAIRTVAQMLAQRCQCYLLMGRPEEALRELTLLNDLRGFLTAEPQTLVAAMIHVAIQGLYAGIVADGLRLHAWGEPQLIAISRQIEDTHLLGEFTGSIQTEHAAFCRTTQTTDRARLGELFTFGDQGKLRNPTYWLARWAPRGWLYQNIVTIVTHDQTVLYRMVDPANGLVRPMKESAFHELPRTPYTLLASLALPNYLKGVESTARNQTLLNEALIACALERYHRARGEYPETLDTLVPSLIEKLPHDLIGGGPLRYRRSGDGRFLLYSIGWNEIDEGGREDKSPSDGDWVWDPPRL